MNLKDCHNVDDFRKLAKKKLPSPIFHYIDGGSDDEVTLKRNTDSFNKCDLIPNVLAGSSDIDLSTTVLGQKGLPITQVQCLVYPPCQQKVLKKLAN